MKNNKSGIRYGIRYKQNFQNDIYLLIRLGKYLRQKYNMEFRREWYVGFDKTSGKAVKILREVRYDQMEGLRWKNPDLLCLHPKTGLWIIEVDGKVHNVEVAKTNKRNEIYKNAGIKYIVLDLELIKFKKIKIEEELDWKMMKLLHGAPIGTG